MDERTEDSVPSYVLDIISRKEQMNFTDCRSHHAYPVTYIQNALGSSFSFNKITDISAYKLQMTFILVIYVH